MATLITTSGQEQKVTPANGKKFTLEELQNLVNGYIEVIPYSKSELALLDENALNKNPVPSPNPAAYQKLKDRMAKLGRVLMGNMLYGPVLIVKKSEMN